MLHQSNSSVQLAAEAEIRESLEHVLRTRLAPATVLIDGTSPVKVDGVSEDETVFVEIFAHQGRFKTGQRHKIATDALKLITIGRERPGAQLVIAVTDKTAAVSLKSNTWLAAALRLWKVKVEVVPITDATRTQLLITQATQKMDNTKVLGQTNGREEAGEAV